MAQKKQTPSQALKLERIARIGDGEIEALLVAHVGGGQATAEGHHHEEEREEEPPRSETRWFEARATGFPRVFFFAPKEARRSGLDVLCFCRVTD